MVRSQLARFAGREVKQTGDGFLATFDGPARAVDCAGAIRAVNIAARIGALAEPSEILVSGTVRDLVVGSQLRFIDAGTHDLKGVPGEWRVYRLADAAVGAGEAHVDSRERPTGADRIARGAARHAPGLLRGLARLQGRRSKR
jgi:class 3 adenylate cyclase